MYSRKPISSVPCAFKDDKYIQLNHVGKGTYGQVFRASRKSDNLEVALKKITEINSHGFSVLALREIHILKSFNHPNLVKMLDVVIEKEPTNNNNRQQYNQSDLAPISKCSTYLVFEYCQHDLEGMFLANIQFTLAQTKRIVQSILQGLAELHRKNIIHRDIKTDNILYTKEKIIKIADFGLSFDMNINKGRQMTKKMQNTLYRAPEIVLEAKYYTSKVDIWSVGIILCSLLFRKQGDGHFNLFPQRTAQEFSQAFEVFSLLGNPEDETIWPVQSRENLAVQLLEPFMGKFTAEQKANFTYKLPLRLRELDPKIDDTTLEMICKMLTMDPAQRYSAEECLAHKFFSQAPSVAADSEMPQIEQGQEFHRMTVQTRINKEMQIPDEQKKVQAAPQLPRSFTQQQPRNILQQQMQGQRPPQQGPQQQQQRQPQQQNQRWPQQQLQQQQGNQTIQQQRNGGNNNCIKNMNTMNMISNFQQQESHRNAVPLMRINSNNNGGQCAPGKISQTAPLVGGDHSSNMNNTQDNKQYQPPQKQQLQQQANKFCQNPQPPHQLYRAPSQNMQFPNTNTSQCQQQQYPSILHNSSNKPILSNNANKKNCMNQQNMGINNAMSQGINNIKQKVQFPQSSQITQSNQFQPIKYPQQQQQFSSNSNNGNVPKQHQYQQNPQQRNMLTPGNGKESLKITYPQQYPAKQPLIPQQSHFSTFIEESSEIGNQYQNHDDSQSTEVSNNLDHDGQIQSSLLQTPLNVKRKNSYTSSDALSHLINSSNKMNMNTNYENNLESPRKKIKVDLTKGQLDMNSKGQLNKTQESIQGGLSYQTSQNCIKLQEDNSNAIIPEIAPKQATITIETLNLTQTTTGQSNQQKSLSPLVESNSNVGQVLFEKQDQQLLQGQQLLVNQEINPSNVNLINPLQTEAQKNIPPSPIKNSSNNSSFPNYNNVAMPLNNNNTSPCNNPIGIYHTSGGIEHNTLTQRYNDQELVSPVNNYSMGIPMTSGIHLMHGDYIIQDIHMNFHYSPLLQCNDQQSLSPIGFQHFYQSTQQQTGADGFSGN